MIHLDSNRLWTTSACNLQTSVSSKLRSVAKKCLRRDRDLFVKHGVHEDIVNIRYNHHLTTVIEHINRVLDERTEVIRHLQRSSLRRSTSHPAIAATNNGGGGDSPRPKRESPSPTQQPFNFVTQVSQSEAPESQLKKYQNEKQRKLKWAEYRKKLDKVLHLSQPKNYAFFNDDLREKMNERRSHNLTQKRRSEFTSWQQTKHESNRL